MTDPKNQRDCVVEIRVYIIFTQSVYESFVLQVTLGLDTTPLYN